MAITRYSSFDKTVNTIAERNAIINKVNHMTVVVKDAIADPSAGAGTAIYRWDAVDSVWILVSKSTYETISFITEELTITNGEVQLSNYPVDNKVWNAVILNNQLIYGELNLSSVNVSNSKITGINPDFNGNTLRVTYAYGSIAVQITSAIEDVVDNTILNNVKTINGTPIIGTGDIVVEGILPTMKTINGENLQGAGDIVLVTDISGKADITYVDAELALKANSLDVYTKTESDSLLANKADKATTIAGYGITDAYTKTATDSAISTAITNLINLAPAALDTLGEIATQLANDESVVSALITTVSTKANISDVYSKIDFGTITDFNTVFDSSK